MARTSQRIDLGTKALLYAAAGVPDYWVVDLARAEIVVHREPGPTGYGAVEARREATVSITGITVDPARLFAG